LAHGNGARLIVVVAKYFIEVASLHNVLNWPSPYDLPIFDGDDLSGHTVGRGV
jgi:hypothetical protein